MLIPLAFEGERERQKPSPVEKWGKQDFSSATSVELQVLATIIIILVGALYWAWVVGYLQAAWLAAGAERILF